jgi:hypothetical protein
LFKARRRAQRIESETGETAMTKTMDIRMHQDNYEFLTKIAKEDRSNSSLCHRGMKMSGAGVFFRAGQDLCPQFLYPDTGLGGTQQNLAQS